MKGPTWAGRHALTFSPNVYHFTNRCSIVSKRAKVFILARAHGPMLNVAPAPHAEDEGPTYPGTCAHRRVADAESLGDRQFAWRFRVVPGLVAWNDLFIGRVELDPARSGGDFIVARHGVGYSYQLAVVADDRAMGVNQVIRGSDLVPSTPRQLLLYRRLGWANPDFGHVALAVGPDGHRLAKRDGSLKLAALRERGVDPRRLVGSLVRSCGWSDSDETMTPTEAIDHYDPKTLAANPWVVRREWVDWLHALR